MLLLDFWFLTVVYGYVIQDDAYVLEQTNLIVSIHIPFISRNLSCLGNN